MKTRKEAEVIWKKAAEATRQYLSATSKFRTQMKKLPEYAELLSKKENARKDYLILKRQLRDFGKAHKTPELIALKEKEKVAWEESQKASEELFSKEKEPEKEALK